MKVMSRRVINGASSVFLATAFALLSGRAESPNAGAVRGLVEDENGKGISGANVTAACNRQLPVNVTTANDGTYTLMLPLNAMCSLHASAPDFAQSPDVSVTTPTSTPFKFTLRVETVTADVIVQAGDEPLIGMDPESNAGAIVLGSQDLDSLPDDPDDLMEDLVAMAGPSASGGVQLYTDGFTGQKLPPKEAIRQIKINQNPYSAQYDHVGTSRIEILTKPGTNPVHGSAQYRISDAALDSRNPFAGTQAPYRSQLATASIGGPASQKLSYFLDFQDRIATNNAVVDAQVLSPAMQVVSLNQTLLVPAKNWSAGGRIDLQASAKASLTTRFEFTRDQADVNGAGGFLLGTAAYASSLQSADSQTAVTTTLGRSTVNDLRFQLLSQSANQTPSSATPTIDVLDAFIGGGAAGGNFARHQSLYELQDYVSHINGPHTMVFGAQARMLSFQDQSPDNFNGQFLFAGGVAPLLDANNHPVLGPGGLPTSTNVSSIERYRRTTMFEAMGLTPSEVRSLGGGASQYIAAAGNPVSNFLQFDFGAFLQDDWKIGSRLTLSSGIRWEGQNTINRWFDFGPRLAAAWMPGGPHSGTVLRAGSGIFFVRFAPDLYVNALHYNGIAQQRFVVSNPDFYPTPMPVPSLVGVGAPESIQTISPSLRTPYMIQTSLTLEQMLPHAIVFAITGANTLGRHLLYSSNIVGGPSAGNNYQYQSEGALDENQFTFSLRRKYRNGFALFGHYTWTSAQSNTDGAGMFPVAQSNIAAERGRAETDIRHYAVVNGTMPGILGTMLSPYIILRSGAPFNIVTGHDNNGDSIFNDRPGLSLDPNRPGVVQTPYGLLDPMPAPGEKIIPRNFGQGPGFAEMNLRVSRAFGLHFNEKGPIAPSAILHRGLFYTPKPPSGVRLLASVTARNLLNSDNRGLPVGNLSSPLFDTSNTMSSATDPSLPMYGNNRRLQFELRLNF